MYETRLDSDVERKQQKQLSLNQFNARKDAVVNQSIRFYFCDIAFIVVDSIFGFLSMSVFFSYFFAEIDFGFKCLIAFVLLLRVIFIASSSIGVANALTLELKWHLAIFGADPESKTIDKMVEKVKGENQLILMTQLVALT